MKKFLLLLMASFLLMLFACGSNEVEIVEEGKEEEEEIKINLNKKLGIKIDDVLDASYFDDEEDIKIKSYKMEDGTKVDELTVRDVAIRIFAFYYDNNEYASEIIIRSPKDANTHLAGISADVLEETWNSLDDEVVEYSDIEVIDIDEDSDFDIAGIIFNSEHELRSLPVSTSDIVENDYFSNESNVTAYEESREKADYKTMYEKARKHIETNDVNESDSAYEIIEIVEPLQDILGEIDVKYDEFDNDSTIYYKGLTDIGSNNYIVPFIETSDKELNILVGFEKEGWLFAEKINFNIDGEKHSYISLDPDTNTLGGSTIREEYIVTSYDSELIENIINGNEIKIRFEGEKGSLDYSLTKEDKKAIETINELNDVSRDLDNLLYRFNN